MGHRRIWTIIAILAGVSAATAAIRPAESCSTALIGDVSAEVSRRGGELALSFGAELYHRGPAKLQVAVRLRGGAEVDAFTIAADRVGERSYLGAYVLGAATADELRRGGRLELEIVPLLFDDSGKQLVEGTGGTILLAVGGDTRPGRRFASDRQLFILFVAFLLLFVRIYLRRHTPCDRLRLGAVLGLVSVLFICTTLNTPWTQTAAADGEVGVCMLGFESHCIVPLAPVDMPTASQRNAIEKTRWSAAAIRAAQVALLIVLIPAFIWLLVAPRSRAAQCVSALGTAAALVLVAATVAYSLALGSTVLRRFGAADVNLLAGSSLLLVSIAITRIERGFRRERIPTATVRR